MNLRITLPAVGQPDATTASDSLGGSGSRLWPLSRGVSQQFLPLLGSRSTAGHRPADRRHERRHLLVDPLIVCSETHRFLVAEQFRFMQRDATAIMLEPTGWNTAPALALAALMALRSGEDPGSCWSCRQIT